MQVFTKITKNYYRLEKTTSLVFFIARCPCQSCSEHWLCTATSGMTDAAKASFAQGKSPGTPITERK